MRQHGAEGLRGRGGPEVCAIDDGARDISVGVGGVVGCG